MAHGELPRPSLGRLLVIAPLCDGRQCKTTRQNHNICFGVSPSYESLTTQCLGCLFAGSSRVRIMTGGWSSNEPHIPTCIFRVRESRAWKMESLGRKNQSPSHISNHRARSNRKMSKTKLTTSNGIFCLLSLLPLIGACVFLWSAEYYFHPAIMIAFVPFIFGVYCLKFACAIWFDISMALSFTLGMKTVLPFDNFIILEAKKHTEVGRDLKGRKRETECHRVLKLMGNATSQRMTPRLA